MLVLVPLLFQGDMLELLCLFVDTTFLEMVGEFVILLLALVFEMSLEPGSLHSVDTLDWQEVAARRMIFLGLSLLLVLTRLRPTWRAWL